MRDWRPILRVWLPNVTEIADWLRPYGPYGTKKTNFIPPLSTLSVCVSVMFFQLISQNLWDLWDETFKMLGPMNCIKIPRKLVKKSHHFFFPISLYNSLWLGRLSNSDLVKIFSTCLILPLLFQLYSKHAIVNSFIESNSWGMTERFLVQHVLFQILRL